MVDDRRGNIDRAMARVRAATSGGTLGGTGQVKGSPSGGGGGGGSGGSRGTTSTRQPTTGTITFTDPSTGRAVTEQLGGRTAQQVIAEAQARATAEQVRRVQQREGGVIAGRAPRETQRLTTQAELEAKQSLAPQSVRRVSDFERRAEMPFGEFQRAPISQIKEAGRRGEQIRAIKKAVEFSKSKKTIQLGKRTVQLTDQEIRDIEAGRSPTFGGDTQLQFEFSQQAFRDIKGERSRELREAGTEAALIAFPLGRGARVAKAARGTGKAITGVVRETLLQRAARTPIGKAVAPITTKIKPERLDPVTRFVKDISVTTATGAGAVKGSEAIGRARLTERERQISIQPGFEAGIGAGFAAAQQELQEGGLPIPGTSFSLSPKGIVSELPFGTRLAKGTFEKGVREEFKRQGLKGSELETAVSAAKKIRTAREIGETGGLLFVSRGAERIGRESVTRGIGKAAKKGATIPKSQLTGKLFTITAPRIAKAGVIEGTSQEITQQLARSEQTNLGNIGFAGGLGGVTAGVIGGTIAATKPTKPGISRTLEIGASISDPFEKPGDILQDVIESTQRKVGFAPPKPQIIRRAKADEFIQFGVTRPRTTTLTPSVGKGKKKARPTVRRTRVSSLESLIGTFTPTPSKTKGQPIFQFVPPEITPDGRTTTDVPIEPTPIEPTPTVPVPTTTETPTNIFQETPISITTPSTVPIGIPTVTPIIRAPPPLPLPPFDLGGAGGAGFGRRRGKKFIRELEQGRRLLSQTLGFGVPLAKPTTVKKSRKKSKRKKKKKK